MNAAEHNHPPRCCCEDTNGEPEDLCPACPEHGELTPAIECPQCHQAIGRPHTDYCRAETAKTPYHEQQADHDPEHVCGTRCSWPTHPVGPRSQPGAHHAQDCPMRYAMLSANGCICGREGERTPDSP